MEKRLFIPFEDYKIPAHLVLPDDGRDKHPALLMCHGYMAYKEGDGFLFAKLAEHFREIGVATMRIDFCSMGENRHSRRFYGLEQLLMETKAAYEYLCQLPEIEDDRVGLIGHSLGGRVVTLSHVLDPAVIITLNGAVGQQGKILQDDQRQLMEKQGYIIVHTSDGRDELLFPKFMEDAGKYVIDIEDINRYQKPFLVTVGASDPTVDPRTSYEFYEKLNNPYKDLLVIEQANHTFTAKTGDYTKVHELGEKISQWLKKVWSL